MRETHGHWRLLAVSGTVLGLATLAWFVGTFDTGTDASASLTPPSAVILIIPVVSLLLIVGVTWYLLTRGPDDAGSAQSYVQCSVCGRSVLREWRLCPYCGSRSDPNALADGSPRHTS